MIARRISGAFFRLFGSKHLPVRQVVRDGVTWIESAWEATPEELMRLLSGGSVIVSLAGNQVTVTVDAPESVDLNSNEGRIYLRQSKVETIKRFIEGDDLMDSVVIAGSVLGWISAMTHIRKVNHLTEEAMRSSIERSVNATYAAAGAKPRES